MSVFDRLSPTFVRSAGQRRTAMKSVSQRQLRKRESKRVSLPAQTVSVSEMTRKASSVQRRTIDNVVVLEVFVPVAILAEDDCSERKAKIAGTSEVSVGIHC